MLKIFIYPGTCSAMDWTKGFLIWLMALIICASSQEITGDPDCRLCPATCLSVPSADGTCPICVCNGVALPDCPNLPELCPRNCVLQRNRDGCNECACRRDEPFVCPPIPPCPEECQSLVDGDGCPRCICEAPPRNCPSIRCPDLCTEELGEDGCRSCRCQRTEVCPPVRPCLRGCIENDVDSGCFACNCTLLSEAPEDPPGGIPFGFGPFGPRRPNTDPFNRRPINQRQPAVAAQRCRSERLICPTDCRVVVGAYGCRECVCGEDAYLCPGVPRCSNRCLFLSPEDKCCRCDCSGPSPGVIQISFVRVPSFNPFRPFEPSRPFKTPISILPFDLDVDFDEIPFLPPFSPAGEPENCTGDVSNCDPRCRVIRDQNGCRVCDCPGDVCPQIRCPDYCVRQIGPNGCPICNCRGAPQPVNPEAEPIEPFDVPSREPTGSGIPLIPGAVEPENQNTPMNPVESPIEENTPVDAMPANPFVPDEILVPNVSVESTNTQNIEPLVPVEQPTPNLPNEQLGADLPEFPSNPDSVFESTLRTGPGGADQPSETPSAPAEPDMALTPEKAPTQPVEIPEPNNIPANDVPLEPGQLQNCSVDISACASRCDIIRDGDGCSICDCPEDMCLLINCPDSCDVQIGPNGCPICNCSEGPEHTTSVDPVLSKESTVTESDLNTEVVEPNIIDISTTDSDNLSMQEEFELGEPQELDPPPMNIFPAPEESLDSKSSPDSLMEDNPDNLPDPNIINQLNPLQNNVQVSQTESSNTDMHELIGNNGSELQDPQKNTNGDLDIPSELPDMVMTSDNRSVEPIIGQTSPSIQTNMPSLPEQDSIVSGEPVQPSNVIMNTESVDSSMESTTQEGLVGLNESTISSKTPMDISPVQPNVESIPQINLVEPIIPELPINQAANDTLESLSMDGHLESDGMKNKSIEPETNHTGLVESIQPNITTMDVTPIDSNKSYPAEQDLTEPVALDQGTTTSISDVSVEPSMNSTSEQDLETLDPNATVDGKPIEANMKSTADEGITEPVRSNEYNNTFMDDVTIETQVDTNIEEDNVDLKPPGSIQPSSTAVNNDSVEPDRKSTSEQDHVLSAGSPQQSNAPAKSGMESIFEQDPGELESQGMTEPSISDMNYSSAEQATTAESNIPTEQAEALPYEQELTEFLPPDEENIIPNIIEVP